jgi:hypothetical protein
MGNKGLATLKASISPYITNVTQEARLEYVESETS